MKHRFASFLWITIGYLSISTLGCSKPDPNPELKDPIFRDLLAEYTETTKKIVDEDKKIEQLTYEGRNLEPRTKERMVNLRDINKSKQLIEKLRQDEAYLKIRVDRRRIQARIDYSAAYSAKKEWPDPHEYELFLAVRKLNKAPRNWDVRVPRLKTEQSE